MQLRILIFAAVFAFCPAIWADDPGFIKGTVTDAETSELLEGIRIRVYDSDWNYLASASTYTDPDGLFITGALDVGEYYLRAVSVYPDMYITQYWFESLDREYAMPLRIREGEDLLGVNFALQLGGYIEGTIRDTDSDPIDNVDIDVYSNEWEWLSQWTCLSKSDGTYRLGPVPAGLYFIRADPALEHGVQQRYWPDAFFRADSTVLAAEKEAEITGIDMMLPAGGYVSGNVKSIMGFPAVDCQIELFDSLWQEQPIHTITTDETGAYTAFGLPDGVYYVKADPARGTGCADLYYPDAVEKADADLVGVVAGETISGVSMDLLEGNFAIETSLEMPSDLIVPGNEFWLDLVLDHNGPILEGLPVFVLLEVFDAYYFWPSWSLFDAETHPFIDYKFLNINEGVNRIEIFPEIIWPATGTSATGLCFYGAVVNWSMTDIAGKLAVRDWSFQ